MKACHAAKETCLDGATDPQACADTFKSCAHDALSAGFIALCDDKLAECGTGGAAGCDKITEACSHGL